MSASKTTIGLDQEVLMKHYSTLIVNLLKEVDEAQYDLTLKSRSRVKGGIAGLRDMEMQELEGIWGRAAVQRAEQSFDSLGEMLGELPRMKRFVGRHPVKTFSHSGIRRVREEIRHGSRAKRDTAVTSPQFTPDSHVLQFDAFATEDHFKGPVSMDEAAVRESSFLDLSDSDLIDSMPELYFGDDPSPAPGTTPAGEDMEDEEGAGPALMSGSMGFETSGRKNVKGLALGAPPKQSVDAAAAGSGASTAHHLPGARRDSVARAAVAGLVDRAGGKSGGGGKRDRSKSRIRRGLPIAATGLGSAVVAGLYEKQQAGKEEEEARREERAARRSARSSPSNGEKPLQPRQWKDYFLDPRSAPPTLKTSSFKSTGLRPLTRPRSSSDAAAADSRITAEHVDAPRLPTMDGSRPSSKLFRISSPRGTGPIFIDTVESSPSPVTSTRRDRRDETHELLAASSSTRRHHQRHSSLGMIPAYKGFRDKTYLESSSSRSSIRERQDENDRDYAGFRQSASGSRVYNGASVIIADSHLDASSIEDCKSQSDDESIISQAGLLPASDTQLLEGQRPEPENVVGPQNARSPLLPAPQSEVKDSESSVFASELSMKEVGRTSSIGEPAIVGETIRRAPPPSAPIGDEFVETVEERDDPPPRRPRGRQVSRMAKAIAAIRWGRTWR